MIYPSPSTPKAPRVRVPTTGAHVLTSVEAIALIEAKKNKKLDELEAKEKRKKEREENRLQREAEKEKKAKEKECRDLARKKEKEERKRKGVRLQKKLRKRSDKENETTSNEMTYDKENECAVCLGTYSDDFVDGILQNEWIQCTNLNSCGLWMHSDCLSREGNNYVCYMCNAVLK